MKSTNDISSLLRRAIRSFNNLSILKQKIADAVKADITSDWGVIDSVLCDFVHSEEFTSSSDVTDEELAKLIKEIISELDRTSIWSDDHGYKQT